MCRTVWASGPVENCSELSPTQEDRNPSGLRGMGGSHDNRKNRAYTMLHTGKHVSKRKDTEQTLSPFTVSIAIPSVLTYMVTWISLHSGHCADMCPLTRFCKSLPGEQGTSLFAFPVYQETQLCRRKGPSDEGKSLLWAELQGVHPPLQGSWKQSL